MRSGRLTVQPLREPLKRVTRLPSTCSAHAPPAPTQLFRLYPSVAITCPHHARKTLSERKTRLGKRAANHRVSLFSPARVAAPPSLSPLPQPLQFVLSLFLATFPCSLSLSRCLGCGVLAHHEEDVEEDESAVLEGGGEVVGHAAAALDVHCSRAVPHAPSVHCTR
eukprot:2597756-Rhodomonas_salina.3